MGNGTVIEDQAVTELLVEDYGVPDQHKDEVLDQVAALRARGTIHALIVAGVRGWMCVESTSALRQFLERVQTHPPENHAPPSST